MHQSFPNEFPNSTKEPFLITSPQDVCYNCIAWAFGDNKKFYWPSDLPEYFWPENIKKEESVDAFVALYESIGYSNCEDGELETGYEKVAIFALNGEPTHAARQLQDGLWTSKLGSHVDVTHTIHAIKGGMYGDVVQYMKRRIASASLVVDAPVMDEKDFKALQDIKIPTPNEKSPKSGNILSRYSLLETRYLFKYFNITLKSPSFFP